MASLNQLRHVTSTPLSDQAIVERSSVLSLSKGRDKDVYISAETTLPRGAAQSDPLYFFAH